MSPVWHPLTDRAAIRAFCRRDAGRYAFHLGDLDPREWPHVDYLAFGDSAEPEALLLVYRGLSTPCVLAFGDRDALGASFGDAIAKLPAHAFIHGFDLDLRTLEAHGRVERRGEYRRMVWGGYPPGERSFGAERARRLGPDDLAELEELYAEAYPDAYFEPEQLARGPFTGVWEGGELVSVAGLHVFSETEGVAMLGNIATRPERRSRGLGRAAVAALLDELQPRVGVVGLNVHAGNEPARRLYERLGFRDHFLYEEALYELPSPPAGPAGVPADREAGD